MSNPSSAPAGLLESLEERVDVLFRELELALRWQRPSILFAVYRSEYVRADAALTLARRLEEAGQRVLSLRLTELCQANLSARLASPAGAEQTILFVHGGEEVEEGDAFLYAGLDRECDCLLDHSVRVVFWLTEDETVNLARCAPDFWALRHRVVEFLDAPAPAQILRCVLETAWQNGKELAATAALTEPLALGDSLLAGLSSQQNGNNTGLLLTLGLLHWRKGDMSQAVHLLETALQDARNRHNASLEASCHQALALLYAERGQLDEAIEACRQALLLQPEQASLWSNLGALYAQVGFYSDALAAFRRAAEKNPQDVLSWHCLGNSALQAGSLEEAWTAYRRATELSPAFRDAWLGLSRTLARLGRMDEALNACRRALALDEHFPETWFLLGDLLARRQRREEALQAYRRALELEPQDFQAWNEVGVLLCRQGEFQQAEEAFRQAIALQPQCGWLYANLALVCSHLGRDDEAIPLYRQAIALLGEEADKALLFSRLGDVCRRVQDEPTARTAYLHAREYGADLDWFGHDLRAAPHSLLHPDEDDLPLSLPHEESDFSRLSFNVQLAEPLLESARAAILRQDSARRIEAEGLTTTEEPLHFACGSWLFEENLGGEEAEELACGAFAAEAMEQAEEMPMEQACGAFAAQESRLAVEPTPPPTQDAFVERSDLPEESGEMACGAFVAQEEASFSTADERSAAEWNAQGNACLAAGRYEEAIAAYLRAIQLTPGFFWPYVQNLALAYHERARRGDRTAPSADWLPHVEAVAADSPPRPSPSLAEEPAAPQEAGEAAEERPLRYQPSASSLRLMQEALQEDPLAPKHGDSSPVPLLEATLPTSSALEAGEEAGSGVPAAAQDFVPASAQEWNAVGNALLRVGAYERAIAAYARAIALAPQDGWAYGNLALAYCHERRYAEAIPLYQKSLELLRSNREKAIVWNRLGDAYRRLNDHERARAAYQRAAELDHRTSALLQRARMVLLGNRRN